MYRSLYSVIFDYMSMYGYAPMSAGTLTDLGSSEVVLTS